MNKNILKAIRIPNHEESDSSEEILMNDNNTIFINHDDDNVNVNNESTTISTPIRLFLELSNLEMQIYNDLPYIEIMALNILESNNINDMNIFFVLLNKLRWCLFSTDFLLIINIYNLTPNELVNYLINKANETFLFTTVNLNYPPCPDIFNLYNNISLIIEKSMAILCDNTDLLDVVINIQILLIEKIAAIQ